ncbi:alpha/beta hydrolase [Nocardia sp. NPDC050710]|uniref:alpha/beta fold hydrolase n=1 Tax=Nocardia sp. NPDC050710 TaxID=3157220 RepID=UPI00340D8574
MSDTGIRRVALADATLDVDVRGTGEVVVLIQTGLVADECAPLAERLALRHGFRTVRYHRRGYGGSSPDRGPGSIDRDALDCARLLAALEIESAHVVGLSYSGAVALQLAATVPACVRTVSLIEPPPVHIPAATEFRAANAQLVETYRRHGPVAALDQFMTRTIGADWRRTMDELLPGSVAGLEGDADTFFGADLPALLSWHFTAADAATITEPVLYLGGTVSGSWFAEVRQLVGRWLPHAEEVILPGADHSLALTHAPQLAAAIAAFLRRHPVLIPS